MFSAYGTDAVSIASDIKILLSAVWALLFQALMKPSTELSMKPAYLPHKNTDPKPPAALMGALGILMLGYEVSGLASPTLPDAAQWPVRQVVEPVDTSIALPVLTGRTPKFLVHQSQLTRH